MVDCVRQLANICSNVIYLPWKIHGIFKILSTYSFLWKTQYTNTRIVLSLARIIIISLYSINKQLYDQSYFRIWETYPSNFILSKFLTILRYRLNISKTMQCHYRFIILFLKFFFMYLWISWSKSLKSKGPKLYNPKSFDFVEKNINTEHICWRQNELYQAKLNIFILFHIITNIW